MYENEIFSVVAGLALLGIAPLKAQEFPNKVITVVVPFTAGGPTDAVARLFVRAHEQDPWEPKLLSRMSAAPAVPSEPIAWPKLTADGYTLFLHHIGHSTAPPLYRKLPYDAINDFEPIGLINETPMTLVAKKDFPPKDLKELIAYLKANKDKVNLANAGLGAASHLCGMLFMSAIQTDLTTVPYSGTAPAMNDLLGGQVDLMCDQTTNTTTPDQSGKNQSLWRDDDEAHTFIAQRPDHGRSWVERL